MTPIERIRAKATALEALGLGHYASPVEIKDAWKRIAFDTHPDRNDTAHAAFAEAKAAYDFLREETRELPAPEANMAEAAPRKMRTGPRLGARPKVQTRTHALSPEATAACRALLDTAAKDDGSNVVYLADDAGRSSTSRDAITDHVPTVVHRCGRSLTYVISGTLAEGKNRVALPTAILEGKAKVRPMILAFLASEAGAGAIRVPDDVRSTLFPGARKVEIRFASA
jgi:hypothetical protein